MRFKFYTILSLAIVAILLVWVNINGTPWTKKQFKLDVAKYLDGKYDQEIIFASEVSYSFKLGTYSILVRPKNMDHITFAVMQSQVNKKRTT